jgi:hypothetical protein
MTSDDEGSRNLRLTFLNTILLTCFTGKSHRIYDSLIYNQERTFQVHKKVDFKEERNKIK